MRRAEMLKSMIRMGMKFVPNTLEAYRFYAAQGHWLFQPPPEFRMDSFMLDDLPAVWLSHPVDCQARVVLYLHGGGYVIGSNRTHLELACRITQAAQAQTLMLEYRLAPENPYPAALDDVIKAYRWLLSHGTRPNQIILAGDSAGGGLTLAAMMAIRDSGLPSPAGGICLSPWLDLTCEHASQSHRLHRDPLITPQRIQFFARHYAGEQDPSHPGLSPLFGDFHDLPPLLVQVGGDEILLNESKTLRRRSQGHFPLELQVWPHMFHVWHFAARFLPQGHEAIREIGHFARKVVPLPDFSPVFGELKQAS